MDSAQRQLVLVGAALGTGRWLAENLLPFASWSRVVLIDSTTVSTSLDELDWKFDTPVLAVSSGVGMTIEVVDSARAAPLDLSGDECVIVLAIPDNAMVDVARVLISRAAEGSVIYAVTATMLETLERFRLVFDQTVVFGLHPLFDNSARTLDGQSIYVGWQRLLDSRLEVPEGWLSDAVVAAGGILRAGNAEEHDRVMSVVQTMSHQMLVAFADAVSLSGLDLERDIWASRTPLFETLYGLSIRALDGRQQGSLLTPHSVDAAAVNERLQSALRRIDAAVKSSDDEVTRHLIAVKDSLSGSLFDSIQRTASLAVAAAQAMRSDLARYRRNNDLVGIRRIGNAERLRVGRIVELSASDVVLSEQMIGKKGSAALLDGPGSANVRKLGVPGHAVTTRFSLGHIELVIGEQLDDQLNAWLGFVQRDVRFLVPESVAGSGVLTIVASTSGVRDCRLIDEVVRTGQRSVVIRMSVRADRDVERTVEMIQELIGNAYRWPAGLAKRVSGAESGVYYLGPPGSFSEIAARQCAHSVGIKNPLLQPVESFQEVLSRVERGGIAVLPITSSASGLVSRAVAALLESKRDFVAAGVVDVPVRFDAYVPSGLSLEELEGARVFSHPQGLAQCQRFIQRWKLVPVPCASTSAAMELLATGVAGVALANADSLLDGSIRLAEREVDDLSGSITRFLAVGGPAVFGDLQGGSIPTLKSLWVAPSLDDLSSILSRPGAAYDEILSDDEGQVLLITSRGDANTSTPRARNIGRIAWSPRTPVVRVNGD